MGKSFLDPAMDGLTSTPLVRPDFDREQRKGVPEVILTESKSIEQVMRIAQRHLAENARAILSRASPELEAHLCQMAEGEIELEWHGHARAAVLRRSPGRPKPTGG